MPDLLSAHRQIISLPGLHPGCELVYIPQFLPPEEADRLLHIFKDQVAWQQSTIRIAGKQIPIPRLNAWYGDADANYGYSGIRLPTNPWFDALSDLRSQVNAETNGVFNSALLNLYRNGNDSVAWHSDDEPELGPSPLIASISLGATRRFQLREKSPTGKQLERRGGSGKFSLDLEHGALLVMVGDTQHHWQHQIPKEPAVAESRINITFRKIISQ